MSLGTVKWFNPSKGYGFVEPSDGSKDVFIHISALERAGIGSLNEGQKIEYELVPGNTGKTTADRVTLVYYRRSHRPAGDCTLGAAAFYPRYCRLSSTRAITSLVSSAVP